MTGNQVWYTTSFNSAAGVTQLGKPSSMTSTTVATLVVAQGRKLSRGQPLLQQPGGSQAPPSPGTEKHSLLQTAPIVEAEASASPDILGDLLGDSSPELERMAKKHSRDGVSNLTSNNATLAQNTYTWPRELIDLTGWKHAWTIKRPQEHVQARVCQSLFHTRRRCTHHTWLHTAPRKDNENANGTNVYTQAVISGTAKSLDTAMGRASGSGEATSTRELPITEPPQAPANTEDSPELPMHANPAFDQDIDQPNEPVNMES